MDIEPPDDYNFWNSLIIYVWAAVLGIIGSCAGMIIAREPEKPITQFDVTTHTVAGFCLGLGTALVAEGTWGFSPLLFGVILFMSFRARAALRSLSRAATRMAEAIFRTNGKDDE